MTGRARPAPSPRRIHWLDAVRKHRLDRVRGWTWDAFTSQWEEGFARLVAYVEQHGHAMVPQSWVVDRYRLGTWVAIQRTNHAQGRGLPDREERLQALPGWSWDPRADQWEEGFRYLIAYVEEYGHCLVPRPYVVAGYRLGTWVGTQRGKYAKGALAQPRVQRLQDIPGWSWDPDSDQWDKYFAMLSEYVEEHGHARVPGPYTVDGYPLGQWVAVQRSGFAKQRLPQARIERLQALPDWSWDLIADQWEEGFTHLTDRMLTRPASVSGNGQARSGIGMRKGGSQRNRRNGSTPCLAGAGTRSLINGKTA